MSKACAALFALALGACVHTEPFRSADGTVVPESVAVMERTELGGVPQSIWIRGLDRSAPLLVLLHGGPGASESALFRHFDAELERHFVVVYWDQRGAGRSYAPALPPSSLTIGRMLHDLDELVDQLRVRFGERRVVLLAHSWGTVLGTLYAHACPAKVALYAGTGQIVSKREGDRRARAFALAAAHARDDRAAIEALQRIDVDRPTVDDLFALSRAVERTGGTFHAGLSTGKLLLAALSTDEAGLLDLALFGRGNRFSHEALLGEFAAVDLTPLRRFDVPVVLLLGRHDMVTPSALAEEWFDRVEAPAKRLVWFERSAHNAPFEEPARFVKAVKEIVRDVDGIVRPPGGCRLPPSAGVGTAGPTR